MILQNSKRLKPTLNLRVKKLYTHLPQIYVIDSEKSSFINLNYL